MRLFAWLAGATALTALAVACSSSAEPTPVPTAAPPATAAPTATPAPTAPTARPVATPTLIPSTATPAPTPTRTPVPTPTPTPRPVVALLTLTQGTGEYQYRGTTQWVSAKSGVGLDVGDSARTAANSRLSVQFQDGSVLILEPDTQVEIQNYSQTTQGTRVVTRIARVALIQGDLSGDVRQDLVYPPSVFEIVTKGEITTIPGTLKE